MAARRRRKRIVIPHEARQKDPSLVMIILFCATGWLSPIGGLMLLKKLRNMWLRKKEKDYRSYAAVIGDDREVSINELSAKLDKSPALVISDLQAMIDKGYLGPEAYIDRRREMLILEQLENDFAEDGPVRKINVVNFNFGMHGARKKRAEAQQERVVELRPEPAAPQQQEPPQTEPQPEPQWQEDNFEEKLRRIRELNDEIADEEVSQRIDRIGELTASIFFVVREKPEHRDEVRKFMNYYLPTTLKLLKSYSLMEKQSYQGENIVASRRKIENILDTLIAAFEQQQDRLFKTEAMNVEADIEVLETMMAKDGLVTPKGASLRSSGKR